MCIRDSLRINELIDTVHQLSATALNAHLAAPRERYLELLKDPSTLEDVLQDGARRARSVARDTLERVRERVGLPRLPR